MRQLDGKFGQRPAIVTIRKVDIEHEQARRRQFQLDHRLGNAGARHHGLRAGLGQRFGDVHGNQRVILDDEGMTQRAKGLALVCAAAVLSRGWHR